MTDRSRGAICIAVLGLGLVPGRASQKASSSSSATPAHPVSAAVVELLAVGPGSRGQNQECSATGFLINEDGYILTNAHVVEKARECLAKAPGARIVAKFARPASPEAGATGRSEAAAPSVSCELVSVDEVHDLAVMKTERPVRAGQGDASPYAALEASEVAPATPVKVTGHPAFAWDSVTQSGHVFGRKTLALSQRSKQPSGVLVLDIQLKSGNSGSPVYLEAGGGVVGVVEGQDPHNSAVTVAVPIREAIDFLDRLGVRWHAAPKQGGAPL